jgi:hypothetical protein
VVELVPFNFGDFWQFWHSWQFPDQVPRKGMEQDFSLSLSGDLALLALLAIF